ncbi:MAG: right-handed parallel beta-helix repeat-containing protein, partial [Nitrospinota bacterium]|nr:right-handed parallel beta-helix repeat-containing protein [Nitrospinota bacterium]
VAADGFCSLREAINNVNIIGDTTGGECVTATGGDIISIPAGTYRIDLTGVAEDFNGSGDFDICVPITLQGAGAATTIIDGNGAVTNERVIHIVVAVAVVIDGVTIQNGLQLNQDGGGVFNGGSLTVTNSIISGNTTTPTSHSGGGIVNPIGSTLLVTDSTITANSSSKGHGIGNSGSATVIRTNIVDNNASTNAGGGIYNDGTLLVSDSVISGNREFEGGGGIYNLGTATVNTTTISGNSGFRGGGICNDTGGTMTLNSCTLNGNSGWVGGVWNVGTIFINNSTFSGNNGGGIENFVGTATIVNSTFAAHTGSVGAAIESSSGLVNLANTIIAGNTGIADCLATAPGVITTAGYNIDSDGTCLPAPAVGDLPANALIAGSLGPLANNGGLTMTHALTPTSPAIDTGSCVFATDQRGVVRPQGLLCDIGAFEIEQFLLSTAVVGGGTVTGGAAINCPGVCTELVAKGGSISLTATPAAGQAFFGWTGGTCDGMLTNPCAVTMNMAQTITALFATDGLIVTVVGPGAVTSDVGGVDCPALLCGAAYAPGSPVNLTATPTGAAVFTGWTVTSGTCAAATTPCAVTVTGIITVTARFDLYGCTNPAATNYNPAATLDDGSCAFPPPPPSGGGGGGGGGGSGGGGIGNQAPYYPGGGSWLVSPDQSANGNGATPFVWRKLADLDGDAITYYLYVCPGGDFTNCQPLAAVNGNEGANRRYAGALGASGMALLLIGFGFTRGGRRAMLVTLATLALTSSAALIACGASGSGDNSVGVTVSACSKADAESLCRENFTLAAGHYQWKVVADDGRDGGLTESEVRIFIVN